MSQNQRLNQKCIAYAKESCGELTRRHLVYQIVAPRVIRRHLRSGSRRILELTVPKASQHLNRLSKPGGTATMAYLSPPTFPHTPRKCRRPQQDERPVTAPTPKAETGLPKHTT